MRHVVVGIIFRSSFSATTTLPHHGLLMFLNERDTAKTVYCSSLFFFMIIIILCSTSSHDASVARSPGRATRTQQTGPRPAWKYAVVCRVALHALRHHAAPRSVLPHEQLPTALHQHPHSKQANYGTIASDASVRTVSICADPEPPASPRVSRVQASGGRYGGTSPSCHWALVLLLPW